MHYNSNANTVGKHRLTKNEIRLRYSGFVVFTTQVLGVITGLIFTLLLTRNMTVSQFGIWTNIFDYAAYFMLFSNVLPFWVTRFAARGKEGTARTGILSQLSIATASVAIYIPVIFLISHAIGTSAYLLTYFISGLYILTFFMVAIFESVLQAVKPQATGFGFIIQEIVKVIVAVILILGFHQIFLGAILALILGPAVQILYYCRVLFGYLKERAKWGYLREWLKGSPAMAYSAVGGQLVSFCLILLFLYGGEAARAYYQSALSFTTIIGYSSSLAVALYPKLLAKSCSDEDVGLSFRTVMMLAIPFASITMVMSVSFLTILKAPYGAAWPVLVALTIDTLIQLIYTFYNSCLMGVEAFDAEGKISFRHLLRSKIFKVFTVPYIQAAIALPLSYYVLTQTPIASSVQAAVEVISILIVAHLSTFVALYWFMRSSIRIPVSWRSTGKYILAAVVMAVVLFLLPTTSTLLSTIAKALAGFGLYVVLLLAIDKQARELIKLVWLEIRVTVQQLTSKSSPNQKNYVEPAEN